MEEIFPLYLPSYFVSQICNGASGHFADFAKKQPMCWDGAVRLYLKAWPGASIDNSVWGLYGLWPFQNGGST